MKINGRRLFGLVLIALVGGCLAWWRLNVAAHARAARADFEWFSTLGFPDVKGCPYVRVATGETVQMAGKPPTNIYLNTFLLATNTETFTILDVDLRSRTLTNSPAHTPEYERTGFELIDLRREFPKQLKEWSLPPPEDSPLQYYQHKARGAVSDQDYVFTQAWGCWRQGLDSEALRLYALAEKMPIEPVPKTRKLPVGKAIKARLEQAYAMVKSLFSKKYHPDPKPPLREDLERSLAGLMINRTVEDFEDLSNGRPLLLAEFEDILRNYPRSQQRTNVVRMACKLRLMIAEDTAHVNIGPKDLAAMSVEDRVREIIFQLRDENEPAWQWRLVPEDDPGSTNDPAQQLVRLEYAAVPQLIAELDSDTLTRVFSNGNDIDEFSAEYPGVCTMGDLSGYLLGSITGHIFSPKNFTSRKSSHAERAHATRQAAEAWWAEFQRRGERQMLIEGIAAEDGDTPAQAELLLTKYPAAATAAIITGIRAASGPAIRNQLIGTLAKTQGPDGVAFLRDELLNGPDIESRVAAAEGLRDHGGKKEAIAAMSEEWAKLAGREGNGWADDYTVAQFLAGCDSVEAISTLTNNLRQRPVDVRFGVIESLADTSSRFGERGTNAPSAETLAAVEKALAMALGDKDDNSGMSGSWGDLEFSDPPICDVAAHFLAHDWPERYHFDLSASLKTRELQRIQCLNVWRATNNLAALPLPAPRTTKVAPKQAAKITLIEWLPDGVKPSEDFAARIAKLKDKRFRSADFIRLLTDFAKKPEPGASGLDIKAVKDEDLTGVRLLVKLKLSGAGTTNQIWHAYQNVVVGKEVALTTSTQTRGLDEWSDPEEWSDLDEAIGQALDAKPETPFVISVRLIPNK